MNFPSPLARIVGTPAIGVLLCLFSSVAVIGWSKGNLPWWWAAGGVLVIMNTVGAMRQVRAYKAWAADWQAMGRMPAGAGEATSPKPRRRASIYLALLYLVVFPVLVALAHTENPNTALSMLWLCAAVYLAFAALRWLFTRGKGRAAAKPKAKVKTEAAPVATWLLARASESPSRIEATHNLPDYAARLLT